MPTPAAARLPQAWRNLTVRIESCPGAHIGLEVEDGGGPWLPRAPTQAAAAGLTSSACSAPLLACARRAASPDVRLT